MRIRLSAGNPAPYQRSRVAAPPTEETVEIKRIRPWNPSDGSEDAILLCGDKIPWPVVQAFGGHFHGQVWCSEHGYQPKLTKAAINEIQLRARKALQCPPSTPDQSTLDLAPF